MKTVVYSTTTAWNVGDDYIRAGVELLVDEALGETPSVMLHDRNPRMSGQHFTAPNATANRMFDGIGLRGVDLIVIAGTPDWGKSNAELYRKAAELNIPIWFIGIGGVSDAHLAEHVVACPEAVRALERAEVVIARDDLARLYAQRFASVDVRVLPCPAMLAGLRYGLLGGNKRGEAIITSDARAVMHCAMNDYTSGACSADLVCHSTFERDILANRGYKVFTHYDPSELLRFVARHKVVRSGRLHGAISALGCGCDVSILDGCDERIVRGFGVASEYSCDIDGLKNEYMAIINERHTQKAGD